MIRLAPLVLLSGCQVGVGMNVDFTQNKEDYVYAGETRTAIYEDRTAYDKDPNPWGVIRAEQAITDNVDIYFEHESSITQSDPSDGRNKAGAIYWFK